MEDERRHGNKISYPARGHNGIRISVNTRILAQPLTGVQRYTGEMVQRMGSAVQPIAPKRDLMGVPAHLWEQAVLPLRAGRKLLWSPSATGPVCKRNQIVTIHDMAAMDHPEWFTPLYSRMYRVLVPMLARRVKHIIAVSSFTRDRIVARTGVTREKITVIPNGYDSKFYPQTPRVVERTVAELQLPSKRYLLSLCTMEPRKNLARLLEAWRQLALEVDDSVYLVLAGGSGQDSVFRETELTVAAPRVHLTGYVNDRLLPGLYTGAMAFIYPSLYEGFGLPPLEAMACGTPVVVSNTSAIPELVGSAGIRINPLDAKSIRDGLQQILTQPDLRHQLAKAGLERSGRYSWDESARLTMELLTRELSPSRSAIP